MWLSTLRLVWLVWLLHIYSWIKKFTNNKSFSLVPHHLTPFMSVFQQQIRINFISHFLLIRKERKSNLLKENFHREKVSFYWVVSLRKLWLKVLLCLYGILNFGWNLNLCLLISSCKLLPLNYVLYHLRSFLKLKPSRLAWLHPSRHEFQITYVSKNA